MRVMVIGASSNPEKFGNKAVRAYKRRGHEVFAVNPNASEVDGLSTYSDPGDPPGPIDRATIYVPPDRGLGVLITLAARGDVDEVWLNPGAESDSLIREAERLGLKMRLGCSIVDIGERP